MGRDAYGLGTAAAALAAASRAAAEVPVAAPPPPPDDDLAVLADFCPAGRPRGMADGFVVAVASCLVFDL